MTRMVQCVKLGRLLPGLAAPPSKDELGQRIFENISQEAWNMWLQQATILINHYGLNTVDPDAVAFLKAQMEEFFFSEGAAMPEGWTPQSTPAKGGGKGGGPRGK